jgi:hypothetical protein
VAKIRVPLDWDPSSNVFIAVAAPTGGVLNYPVLAQGDPGVTPDIDTAINYTPLAKDDPTPASASWTETSPNVYKLNLALHEGADGANGNTVLDPGDFTGAAPGKGIALNSGRYRVRLQTPKVGGRTTLRALQLHAQRQRRLHAGGGQSSAPTTSRSR